MRRPCLPPQCLATIGNPQIAQQLFARFDVLQADVGGGRRREHAGAAGHLGGQFQFAARRVAPFVRSTWESRCRRTFRAGPFSPRASARRYAPARRPCCRRSCRARPTHDPSSVRSCSPSAATDISPMRIDELAARVQLFHKSTFLIARHRALTAVPAIATSIGVGDEQQSPVHRRRVDLESRPRQDDLVAGDGLPHQGKLQQALGKIAAERRRCRQQLGRLAGLAENSATTNSSRHNREYWSSPAQRRSPSRSTRRVVPWRLIEQHVGQCQSAGVVEGQDHFSGQQSLDLRRTETDRLVARGQQPRGLFQRQLFERIDLDHRRLADPFGKRLRRIGGSLMERRLSAAN